jgi:hypothetical protein
MAYYSSDTEMDPAEWLASIGTAPEAPGAGSAS